MILLQTITKAGLAMPKFLIDKSHSSINFSVSHMMISKVKGVFTSYEANIEADNIEDLSTGKVEIIIDVASINTNYSERDNHLRSADFFHADKYPKITFTSTKIEKIDDKTYNFHGDLTIKDVTKPFTFNVTYNGYTKNPWHHDTYGFSANSTLNRKEFNLLYNTVLESGGLLIGENVDINIELEIYPI